MTMHDIGIIGIGRLGLAYALVLEQSGFRVWGSSYRQDYINELQSRKTDSVEPGIADLLKCSHITFTTNNHEVISACDLIYVMVATPSTVHGDYDVLAVEAVADDLLQHPAEIKNKILVIGSTVNPGTCQRIQDKLRHRGVSVVYCPTFAAQGTVLQNIKDPKTLSIGTDDMTAAEVCKEIFSQIIPADTPVYVMKSRTAEILKLAGNCRCTLEISFFNMIGQLLIDQGLIDDIKTADQYLNFVKEDNKWQFGFGYGGPCYPRDNRSLVYFAQKIGMSYPLGEIVDSFNQNHIQFLVDYFFYNNVLKHPFYFEYVSYKKGVNIFEESHQLSIAKKLLDRGCTVFIESTEFLTSSIRDDLQQHYGDLVQFVCLQDLEEQNISVYKVDFQ